MKVFFAYIRVSTVRQGETGVSLIEQRATIQKYADDNQLGITTWFEERETAAVRGRPAFNRMLHDLRTGRTVGVIFYKVDRSSRNSGDWADVDGLADRDIEVHFASDRLVLARRGDRLTANFQAVMAADFSRDLRDKVKMGYYGRLKQGLYPRPAPIGYLDNGGGRPKTLDPATAPLVRALFEHYASGRFSLRALAAQARQMGIRLKSGKPLRRTQLAKILRNPFYAGTIHVKRTGQTFPGVHEPLISRGTFDIVQQILSGKAVRRTVRHAFLFRRLVRCLHCGHTLIGELQKGRVYYRCQQRDCPTTTVREDVIEDHVRGLLGSLRFNEEHIRQLREELYRQQRDEEAAARDHQQAIELRLANLSARQARLLDAFVDGALDKGDFEQRKAALQREQQDLQNGAGPSLAHEAATELNQFLELAIHADSMYENAIPAERRELIEILTSNRVVDGRLPRFTLRSTFAELVEVAKQQPGGPSRATARTTTHHRRTVRQLLRRFADFVLSRDAECVQRVHDLLERSAVDQRAA